LCYCDRPGGARHEPAAGGPNEARRGFTPNPARLDHATGQQAVRVLHEPGKTTLLYRLHPHGGCLYEAVLS
jgi:hypothetical protein